MPCAVAQLDGLLVRYLEKPAKPLDLPSLRRPPNKRRKLPENSECRQLAEVMPSGKLLKIARSPEPTLTLID
jgi:hypothetical protein